MKEVAKISAAPPPPPVAKEAAASEEKGEAPMDMEDDTKPEGR